MNRVKAQVDPVQLLLAGFDQDESRDRTIARVKRIFASKPQAPRQRVAKPVVDVADLSLPLFDPSSYIFDATLEYVPEARTPSAETAKKVDVNVAAVLEQEQFNNDCLEAFTKFHAGILWRQLELLLWSKDANGAARLTILDWIFAPMEHTHSVTGKVKSILGINVPFSFELCCYVEEVDPDALRAAVANRLLHIKQGAGHRIRASLH
jgi:hypothetical protein